jgi:hypothetical protein
MVRPVSEFPDFKIERQAISPLIDEGARHVVAIHTEVNRDRSLRFALNASIGSLNALLSAASSKCTIGGKPADIDMVADASGNLIYQCHHNPTHKWNLNGNRI